jgi:cobalamin biosynthesis protein CobT
MPKDDFEFESLAIFQRADILSRRLLEYPDLGKLIGNDSRSSENSEGSESSESSEDTESTESKESKDGSDDSEKSEDSETSENTETSEDSENSEDSESSEDSETSESTLFSVIEAPFTERLSPTLVTREPRRIEELLRRIELLRSREPR